MTPQRHNLANLVRNPIFKAFGGKPIAASQQVDVCLAAIHAVDAITAGQGNEQHVNNLAVATNLTMLLCELGWGEEWMGKAKAGQAAVLACQGRMAKHGRPGFSGLELQALRDCLHLHDQQVEQAGRATVSAALLTMHERLQAGQVMEGGAA